MFSACENRLITAVSGFLSGRLLKLLPIFRWIHLEMLLEELIKITNVAVSDKV